MIKYEIKVPSLGESIAEVTIGKIISPSGTFVAMDGEILELETDKVNQVLYAEVAGKITLQVKQGEKVKIGQTIGLIEPSQEVKKSVPSPEPKPVAPPSPLSSASSDGPSLRYTKEEFLSDLQKPIEAAPVQVQEVREKKVIPEASQKQVVRETRRPMTTLRKVIAKKLVDAQKTMAMLTTFNEVDLLKVMELRESYKEVFLKKHGCKLGFMSFFVKAVVSALEAYPDLNAWIDGEEIVHREYYDIGVAVGTDKGVIVPVLRDCDLSSFAEIEQSIENYAKKAREGKLALADLQGGGFTITNGGVYGSMLSTPILLPPQCGILGMHKIEKRPVVIDDQIVIRPMMYLALSYDHRLIDGKEAVSFLVHVKNMLEEPSRLILHV